MTMSAAEITGQLIMAAFPALRYFPHHVGAVIGFYYTMAISAGVSTEAFFTECGTSRGIMTLAGGVYATLHGNPLWGLDG